MERTRFGYIYHLYLLVWTACEKIYYLLDFYHATEHLQTFADSAFNDAQERKNWFLAARSDLKQGKIISLIEQMKQYKKSVCGSRGGILTTQINYFDKRESKGLFDYKKIRQLNLPIGSFAVESLIRQAVNLRLK